MGIKEFANKVGTALSANMLDAFNNPNKPIHAAIGGLFYGWATFNSAAHGEAVVATGCAALATKCGLNLARHFLGASQSDAEKRDFVAMSSRGPEHDGEMFEKLAVGIERREALTKMAGTLQAIQQQKAQEGFSPKSL